MPISGEPHYGAPLVTVRHLDQMIEVRVWWCRTWGSVRIEGMIRGRLPDPKYGTADESTRFANSGARVYGTGARKLISSGVPFNGVRAKALWPPGGCAQCSLNSGSVGATMPSHFAVFVVGQ